MDTRSLENLLDVAGLPLLGEDRPLVELSALTPEALAELEALAQLSLLLRQTLTPVSLRLAFREDLRQSLVSRAMQRQGWRGSLVLHLREHWKLTAAAATASGVSVAVGAIGVVAWYRGRSQF